MTDKDNTHICPVEKAGSLDLKMRRLVHNPKKLLSSYISEGMTVLDVGCGPGFFTVDMAEMVGPSGRAIAADLQDGMLQKVDRKVRDTEVASRITLHKCEENRLGVSEKLDFILLFYMVHEIPDQKTLFIELESVLKDPGKILMVEPPFHVSNKAFEQSLVKAENSGLSVEFRPKMLFSKAAVLVKQKS